MVGLGETHDELVETFGALREHGVRCSRSASTCGPPSDHLPVVRYWHPDEFAALERAAYARVRECRRRPARALQLPRRPARPAAAPGRRAARRRDVRLAGLAAAACALRSSAVPACAGAATAHAVGESEPLRVPADAVDLDQRALPGEANRASTITAPAGPPGEIELRDPAALSHRGPGCERRRPRRHLLGPARRSGPRDRRRRLRPTTGRLGDGRGRGEPGGRRCPPSARGGRRRVLRGSSGADVIDGGRGRGTLDGGAGRDRFVEDDESGATTSTAAREATGSTTRTAGAPCLSTWAAGAARIVIGCAGSRRWRADGRLTASSAAEDSTR